MGLPVLLKKISTPYQIYRADISITWLKREILSHQTDYNDQGEFPK
jgi:hypothetical protein